MADNDYDGSYSEGRDGRSFSGGNSIDYAGYLQGQKVRSAAEAARESYSGGGGPAGAPMNLAQKAAVLGVIFALLGLPLGAFIRTDVTGALLGAAGGFLLGFVVRMGLELVIRPFRPTSAGFGPLPAVLLGGFGVSFIFGPIFGAAAACILLLVWMARNRGR